MCTHEKPDKEKYLGSGKYLKNAVKRYGRNNFTREILEECVTREHLIQAEVSWIAKYDAVNNPEFYNLQKGGFGGDSAVIQDIWNNRTDDQKKDIGDKISKTRKQRGLAKGGNNPMYGRSTSSLVKDVWNNRTDDQKKDIGDKISKTKKERGCGIGKKNSMHGRSAITEKNLKWYTDGKVNKYLTEGTQPEEFVQGRTNISGKIGKRKNEII